MIYLFIGIGGALGASLRFYFSNFLSQFILFGIPLGTMMVNLIGCFAIGFFIANQEEGNSFFLNNFLVIGFLGSFTTFSAFTKEALIFYNNDNFFTLSIYIFLTLTLCLFSTYLGFKIFQNG